MTVAPVASEAVAIPGPAGTLEAAVDRSAETPPHFAGIVCHPHPLHRGTMQNKVVTTVSRALARLGGISLRFNYRGVGASDGAYDGDRGELEDALAAVAWLHTMPECLAAPLVIAGFSFGGAIAYRAAAAAGAAALVTIAAAHSRIPAAEQASFANWLLVHGDEDELIPAAGALEWARGHAPAPQIVRFESTGHFFHGQLPRLAESVSAYLHQTLLVSRH